MVMPRREALHRTHQEPGDSEYYAEGEWKRLPIGTLGQIKAVIAGLVPGWVDPGSVLSLDTDAAVLLDLSAAGVIGLDTQTANTLFAGPTTGAADEPTFRAMVAADLVAHDNTSHTDRTRYIPLVPLYDRRTNATPAYDATAHGSLPARLHIDETDANASFKIIGYAPFIMPLDYVSGTVTLFWFWSSQAAGNNCVWDVRADELLDAGTAATSRLSSSEILAAPAVANTIKLSSKALTGNPTAGALLHIEIGMNSNSASDSNTGTRTLWGAFLQYTADM